MRSKKSKVSGSSKSEEHRASALSFFKNRLFSSNENSADSTSSSRPIQHRSPMSIDIPKSANNWSSTPDRPFSRSFEEPSYLEASCSNSVRPVSVVGLQRMTTSSSHDTTVVKRRPPDDEKKRTSFIVIKEGYLYKKADFRAFHKPHNHRGWKLYRIVLRGHKLYLYKLSSSESSLRSLVPTADHKPVVVHHPGDLFHEQTLRDNYIYGAMFTENGKSVCLLVFTDNIVIGTCIVQQQQWHVDSRIPIDKAKVEKRGISLVFTLDGNKQRTFTAPSEEVQSAWMKAFESQAGLPKITISKEDEALRLPTDDTQLHVIRDINGRRVVQGGSVGALVHELITEGVLDEEYLSAFLLTYSMFTTSATVLDLLKTNVTQTPNAYDRVLDIITTWCTQFPQDVVGEVATGMMSILDTLEETSDSNTGLHERGQQTKEIVLATVNRNADEAGESAPVSDTSTVEDIPGYRKKDGRRPSSVNLSNMLITGLTVPLFLTVDPRHFAEQIYLFHLSLHRQHAGILSSPLSYVPRPQTSPQVLNSLVFTTATPHFLTKLIRQHILIDSQQEDMVENENSTLTRSMLLEHWIRVGIALTDLGDMTGWCAIATGICSLGVIRLKETWKSVDRDLVATVMRQWVSKLADHGFFAQEVWIDGWEKDFVIDQFARIMNPPGGRGLPFFGTLRQAVDRLRKHLSDETDTMVNFAKYWRVYHAIRQSLDAWKPKELEPSTIKVIGPLQAFFEHSVTDFISVPHDFKYLQECSLACEPRIFGQSYDRHRKFDSLHGTDVAPPSSATLTFPEVLEGYTLFQPQVQDIASPRPPIRKKGSNQSMKSDDGPRPRPPEHARSSPRVTNRKMFRRRTYSFPPGGAIVAATSNSSSSSSIKKSEEFTDLDSLHSKTWLGSLIAHRQGSYSAKALLEAVQRKERDWTLTVESGDLVLKASTLMQSDDSVTKKTLKKSASSGFLALTEKGSSGIRSRSGTISSINEALPKEEETLHPPGSDQDSSTPILVNVKAGRLERLVDILVGGVSRYNKDMREQWQLPSSFLETDITPQHLTLDEEEYTSAFFVTYRSFCSCVELLELLREMFAGALVAGRLARQQRTNTLETVFQSKAERTVSSPDEFDWRVVASIQLRVMNLMLYWVEEHFYDFVDEIEILHHVGRFFRQAQDALNEWRSTAQQQQAMAAGVLIDRQLYELRKQFIHKMLSPCYDLKAIDYDTGCSRKVDELYKQLTSGAQGFRTTIAQGTRKSMAFSLCAQPLEEANIVDQQSASMLLQQADQCVRQLFASVTLQDWIQTFDVFEAQSSDLYAWLPAHKASQTPPMSMTLSPVKEAPTAQPTSYHISSDDVMVSDIFTAIEGARRSIVSPSAFSADDLLLAFPSSIQYLYCMHFIIRSWVIHEITLRNIDFSTRVQRIDKFLQMVVMSKSASEQMALFPELKDVEDRPRRVPGFVEYAIASALISPEVRLFSRAWMHVARKYGQTQLETLESLLSHVQRTIQADSMVLVPSVGWVFDRMLELCAAVPDTYNHQDHMINFDKRRYVFHFLQLVMNAQMDLDEQADEGASYLAFIICPDRAKATWKELKEHASRENKQKKNAGIFGKLVNEQLEKLKRDIKERDRIDKEWRDLQHKLQKRQIEQARYLEKQERRSHKHGHQQQHLPKLNSLFRTFRPSLSSSSSSSSDPTYLAQFQTAKASTVINLIHSTTSVASAYTKRDHVFRIVTEEGGQYLFQATNWQDMYDWMQQINNAAREGAVKRRSVLASDGEQRNSRYTEEDYCETAEESQPTRKSVYGVDLVVLMYDGSVPLIAEKCIAEIEKRGLEEVGIYRTAGTGSVVEQLKQAFNSDMRRVDLGDARWADINVVADAFKQFLRNIPGSLMTHTYYDEFIHAAASEDHDQRVYLIKQVLQKLPDPNYTLLKRLIEHFVIVTDFEATNHMYATNLAIVFGPTLLQPAPGPASFATTMSNLGHHQTIVKYLILHFHYLFDIEGEEQAHEDD